jgi:predicted LPLAT superfamily acyltransferase
MGVSGTATPTGAPRNPGPSWGYRFLRVADQVLPEFIYRPLRALGTLIALAGMPAQRGYSRAYLATVLDRPPTWRDVFRHFFACEEALMLRLRIANGRHIPCEYAEPHGAFRTWMETGGPVLLGTMHVGVSDMLGFQLGGRAAARHIHMVRQRVANAHDTDALAAQFGEFVRIIWVNNAAEIPFALKEAAELGGAIALQCDRPEYCARTEAFEFLGARRVFPFTIYHLSLIFERPVLLSFGVPQENGRRTLLHASPLFQRQPGESKADALTRARAHFQDFLRRLERTLRAEPYLWFNFVPLNPPVAPDHS